MRRHHDLNLRIDRLTCVFTLAFALLLPALASGCRPATAAGPGTDTLPVAPTDLTYGADGTLYVSSASAGALFQSEGAAFERLPDTWHRPYGLATLGDGRICLSHYTSADPLERRSAVSCGDGRTWTLEATDLGSGVNGLAPVPGGLWAIGWRDTDIEQRNGVLSLIVDGTVTEQIEIQAFVPQFAAPLPSGGLLVSAWREDASGFTGGALLHVSDAGAVETFSDALQQPSGIAVVEAAIWVADYATGKIVSLDAAGVELTRYAGLEGALGLISTVTDELCVAEAQRNRIHCLDRADILGGLP